MTALQPEPGWGRATRHVRVGRLAFGDPDRAVDRLDVVERVYRYGWAYDERDRDLLGDCFTDGAVWEGSIMGQQPVGPFTGRADIVAWLATFWDEQRDQRRHIFTNTIVTELGQDTATVHAYLMLTATSDKTLAPQTTGPSRFGLAREDDSWRISRLSAGFDAPF